MDWVLREVERSNPEVLAAKAELDAAQAEARAAYAWMPPMLSLELMGLDGPSGRRIELSQSLPFPGRTLLKGRVASHAAERRAAMARMELEKQVLEARQAFYSLARAERVLKAAARTSEALASMAGQSSRRGGFGQLDRMGQVMDTMLAMEREEVESMLPHWRQERAAAEARLNRAMGADPGRPLPPAALERADLQALPAPGEAELKEAVLKSNPELEEARHHAAHALAARRLARSGWLPDLMLEGGLEEDPMGGRLSTFKAGVTLPFLWFWGQAGMSAAAAAELEHARLALEATRLKLLEEARTGRGELDAAREELEIVWGRMLPLAEKGLAQARAGFGNGSVGANEALMAVKGYLMAEERLGHLIWHVGSTHAMLQMLTAARSAAQAVEMNHE